jgi:hypothetical protein
MKTTTLSLKFIGSLLAAMFGLLSIATVHGQTYNYELVSDSSISPADGATITGPSEALSGTFSWTFDPGNSNAEIFAYTVTSLDLMMDNFNMNLSSMPQTGGEQTSIGGGAEFSAVIDLSGEATGVYQIVSVDAGSFEGSAGAPTTLEFDSFGLAPFGGGLFVAKGNIDAVLVSVIPAPEPSAWAMMLGGLSVLAFWHLRQRRTLS